MMASPADDAKETKVKTLEIYRWVSAKVKRKEKRDEGLMTFTCTCVIT
jgi:hypothetical protein